MKIIHLVYLILIIFIISGFSLRIQHLNKIINNCQNQTNMYIKELSNLQKEKQQLLIKQTEEINAYQEKINKYMKQLQIKDIKIQELKKYKVSHTDNECEDLKNALFDLRNFN